MQDTVELEERLFVEGDVIEVADLDAAFTQAVLQGVLRKTRVVLLAGEPFLLGRGDDLSVAHEARRAVVIESRYAEDVHLRFVPLHDVCGSTFQR